MSLTLLQKAVEIAKANSGVVMIQLDAGIQLITRLANGEVHVSEKGTWMLVKPQALIRTQHGPASVPWMICQEYTGGDPIEVDLGGAVRAVGTPPPDMRDKYLADTGAKVVATPPEKKIILG